MQKLLYCFKNIVKSILCSYIWSLFWSYYFYQKVIKNTSLAQMNLKIHNLLFGFLCPIWPPIPLTFGLWFFLLSSSVSVTGSLSSLSSLTSVESHLAHSLSSGKTHRHVNCLFITLKTQGNCEIEASRAEGASSRGASNPDCIVIFHSELWKIQ